MSAFAALASVVVERALDVAALLTIFIVASGAGAGLRAADRTRLAAELLLAGAVGALVVLAFAETAVAPGGIFERALRPWPKVHSLVEQLALGAAVLREPAAALQAAAWSLALWSVDAGVYWAGARALGLGAIMNYPRAVLALSWAGASSALPAAPGAIGTFEAIVKSILVAVRRVARAGARLRARLPHGDVPYRDGHGTDPPVPRGPFAGGAARGGREAMRPL